MYKAGVKFDYDLMANEELKGTEICVICQERLACRWTDYSGQGVCLNCGCAYQLKWGNEKEKAEGKYPYVGVDEKFIPALREYWNETHKFVFTGTSMRETTGLSEFGAWLKEHYPELAA